MIEKYFTGLCAAVAVVLLSGCTPVQTLDTAALRAEAVDEELRQVTDALSDWDASAIEQLQCEQPRLIELPRTDQLDPGVELPLTVDVDTVELLELPASSYAASDAVQDPAEDAVPGAGAAHETDTAPEPEFHLASLRTPGTASAPILPDVIVRVDDRDACVWAMGPTFVVLLGL